MDTNKRLFLTGSTGTVGKSIMRTFLKNNWLVTAFLRQSSKLEDQQGVTKIFGSFDHDCLYEKSVNHDVLIHSAKTEGEKDVEIINSLLDSALKTSETQPCLLIFISGFFVLGSSDEIRDEYSQTNPLDFVKHRVVIEEKLNAYNGKNNGNLRTAVIRLTWIYGNSTSTYLNDYLKFCLNNDSIVYSGNFNNHINFIHDDDVGEIFYLVAVSNKSGIFHGSDGNFASVKELVEGISKILNKPIKEETFKGNFNFAMNINQKILTKRALEINWKPKYTSLLENLEKTFNDLK